jgi:hypothetical protein
MPEEKKDKDDKVRPNPQAKKPYIPPALVEYGTVRELTGGKSKSGTDLLPGSRR